jgi:hypothetical protein
MTNAASYAVRENLRDGSIIEIRALKPEDEAGMLAAVERTSAQSLQRRFFVMKRSFSEKERTYFMQVDFSNHVALVATAQEDCQPVIIGGGRYIVMSSMPGRGAVSDRS